MIITRFYGYLIDDSFIVQNRKNSRKGLKATVPNRAKVGSEDSHHWYDIWDDKNICGGACYLHNMNREEC